MASIEDEMSRFEEEILSLTQDPSPVESAAAPPSRQGNGSSDAPSRVPGFQPRQTQQGQGQGIPRGPGFQPRQMGRPGGPPKPSRPRGPSGFLPHQLRGNQRPPGGPPRFPHLPPPPPHPPHSGPMHGVGGPPPHMMGPGGHLPPPHMPPYGMMPHGMGPPPGSSVTVSAKPTTYASKPVLNKKKKFKKAKKLEVNEKDIAEDKDTAAKPVQETPSQGVTEQHRAAPLITPAPARPTLKPALDPKPLPLPRPPGLPSSFAAVPPPHSADPSQGGEGGSGAYEQGMSGAEGAGGHKKKDKKKKFVRTAAGLAWEDDSLSEWDPNDFRLFAGDLGNEVTEDTLTKVFGSYPSYLKCKIVRDKRTNKTKGYGFVSFKDPRDFVQAMKDWNGKYVGNRPIKLLKSTWKDRDISMVKRKQKEKDKLGLR